MRCAESQRPPPPRPQWRFRASSGGAARRAHGVVARPRPRSSLPGARSCCGPPPRGPGTLGRSAGPVSWTRPCGGTEPPCGLCSGRSGISLAGGADRTPWRDDPDLHSCNTCMKGMDTRVSQQCMTAHS